MPRDHSPAPSLFAWIASVQTLWAAVVAEHLKQPPETAIRA